MSISDIQWQTFSSQISAEQEVRQQDLKRLASACQVLGENTDAVAVRHKEHLIATKGRFNLLSILTKHHLEELHSKLLVYLLDPRGTHDCHTLFLHLFLEELRSDKKIAEILLGLSDQELPMANIRPEWEIRKGDLYGRIDIFLETPHYIIAIENKIYASEQTDQIARYATYCRDNGKKYLVLYLTLEGDYSNESLGEEYFPISYRIQDLFYFGLVVMKSNNNSYLLMRERVEFPIVEAITAKMKVETNYELQETEDGWYCWRYFTPLNMGLDFGDYKLNFVFLKEMPEILQQFDREVTAYLESWLITIDHVKNLPT